MAAFRGASEKKSVGGSVGKEALQSDVCEHRSGREKQENNKTAEARTGRAEEKSAANGSDEGARRPRSRRGAPLDGVDEGQTRERRLLEAQDVRLEAAHWGSRSEARGPVSCGVLWGSSFGGRASVAQGQIGSFPAPGAERAASGCGVRW